MDFFYSGQLRNYRLQIIRAFSNLYVQYGTGEPVRVPCRYGDPSRISENIVRGGSENKVLSAPFITVLVTGISMSASRRQDPTFVDTVQVNERNYNQETQHYGNDIGNRYSVQRYMPVPYEMSIQVDIWTSNLDTKEQLAEQIFVLYNPSVEFQTSVNPLDWSVISLIEMQDNMVWTSRSIPQGNDNPIDVMTMNFKVPIWINPPAKVRKQSIIQEIIMSITDTSGNNDDMNWSSGEFLTRIFTTPGDYGININVINGMTKLQLTSNAGNPVDTLSNATVLLSKVAPILVVGDQFSWDGTTYTVNSNDLDLTVDGFRNQLPSQLYNCHVFNQNQIQFVNSQATTMTFTEITPGVLERLGLPVSYPGGNLAWWRLLQAYGDFHSFALYGAAGSQLKIRLTSNPDPSQPDIIGNLDADPTDQNQMIWRIDTSTLPGQHIIDIDAVIDPQKTGPAAGLAPAEVGQRYLLTNNPSEDTVIWGDITQARVNDIIEYNGIAWYVAWDYTQNQGNTSWVYNRYSGKYLLWQDNAWQQFLQGLYRPGEWHMSI